MMITREMLAEALARILALTPAPSYLAKGNGRAAGAVRRVGEAGAMNWDADMKEMKAELAKAHAAGTLICNESIMRARRKPQGVSETRWRMELRRRDEPERYAFAGVAR